MKIHSLDMSNKVNELLKIIENNAKLNIAVDKDYFERVDKLSFEEREIYFQKLGNVSYICLIYSIQSIQLSIIKKEYFENEIDFKTLKARLDNLFKEDPDQKPFSEPITERERKHGYSWAFLSFCNQNIGISLRKLEEEIGIARDTLARGIRNYLNNQKLNLEIYKLKNQISEKEKQLEKLKI